MTLINRNTLLVAGICAAVTYLGVAIFSPLIAYATESQPLLPPVNHESGRIEQIITAQDNAFRYRAYVLTWRSARIVVTGSPIDQRAVGDNADVVVYRTEVDGHKVLRFETASAAPDDPVTGESTNSSAFITLGTGHIDEVISAESDGYRFVAYYTEWHGQRVIVIDPHAEATRIIGDKVDFKVVRFGLGANQRLAFTL
jgi:hypothetical protein